MSPYSVQVRENADLKNSQYGHFPRSVRQSFISAGTCKCYKELYGYWYNFPPYVVQLGAYEITGMFTTVIHSMIIDACGSCDQYSNSTLHFDVSRTGLDPNRRSVYELKISITNDVDVSFPYYERRSTKTVVPGSIFVPLIPSPGCAFIVRDELNVERLTMTLILNVLKVWPLLLVSYCIATLFGILIWSTVSILGLKQKHKKQIVFIASVS